MDHYYLEFLKELHYCLEYYEHSGWSNWMKKSIALFINEHDLTYFFSAFGGMGSFNDRYYEKTEATDVINVLKTITFKIARVIKDNGNNDILNILKEEQGRYLYNKKLGYEREHDIRELNYLNYLIDNYHLSNLHNINDIYIKELSLNKRL